MRITCSWLTRERGYLVLKRLRLRAVGLRIGTQRVLLVSEFPEKREGRRGAVGGGEGGRGLPDGWYLP